MRILLLGDAIAEHLLRWSKAFARRGHEVHVMTWNPRMLAGYEPVVVHLVRKWSRRTGPLARAVNLLRLRFAVRRLIARIRPDLVHAHSAGAYAWLTMFTGFRPYLISPWGNDVLLDVHQSTFDRFFTVHALRRADLVHCEGQNTKQAMVGLGVEAEKILVMPLGVDVEKFSPGSPPAELVQKYPLSGRKVVVSTRTLYPVHNVESVIRAAPLVLERVPEAVFLIVGGGVEEGMLRSLAESLGIAGAVVFTGRVAEDEMVACLRAADVYVSTSLSESGLAVSMAEAMACGLPIVNTDVGDIYSWIQEGDGGFVVPVKRPDLLADRIAHVLENAEQRSRWSAINRRIIVERDNVEVVARRMEEVYRRLVSARGAG